MIEGQNSTSASSEAHHLDLFWYVFDGIENLP
jgi:hypothetical protein